MQQMAYRPHFFMMVAGKIIRIGLLFFFFQAIFLKVDRIGQWTFDQVLLLFITFHIVDFLISITFHRNLSFSLPRLIQTGELDTRLVLPVNRLFMVSLANIDLMDLFSFIPSLGFLGYVLYRLHLTFSWPQVIAYIALLLNSIAFLYALSLMIATISFWTTQSYGIARIFDNVLKIGRYPLDIFDGFWKVIFIYILPLFVIAQLPVQTLLKAISWEYVLFAFGVSATSLFVALNFWKIGLRNYLSASS